MDFNVIDVETANPDYSSICQIGIVSVRNGKINSKWKSFVNPETIFDEMNVSIHGIKAETVRKSPNFSIVYEHLKEQLKDYPLIHHGAFDRVALNRACDLYQLDRLDVFWIDSSTIVRKVWSEFSKRGYGLKNLANHFGYEFNHHDALEDSIFTAKLMLKACNESKTSIDYWKYNYSKSSDSVKEKVSASGLKKKIEGKEDGPLYGENLVITGQLSLPRRKVAKIASDAGCTVSTSVSKKTTLLVVGIQDNYKLNGYKKSTKHRKAEELISKGCSINIISERDFISMLSDSGFHIE